MARPRIGELLVQQGRIDAVQLQSALAHQARWGGRLGRALVQLGFLPERTVLEAVGGQLGVSFVEIGDRVVPREVLGLVPAKLVRTRRVLPLERLAGRGGLVVAAADPADLRVLDDVAFAAGLPVKAVLASEADLDRAIARLLDGVVTRRDGGGFADREDAIVLGDDAGPLPLVRDPAGGPGKHRLN